MKCWLNNFLALANEAFAVGDASVGEKASDDNKLDEELTETKFIVTEQENQIKLLEGTIKVFCRIPAIFRGLIVSPGYL